MLKFTTRRCITSGLAILALLLSACGSGPSQDAQVTGTATGSELAGPETGAANPDLPGTPSVTLPDAGTPDTGTPDAGTPDAGTPDTGTPDAGTPDTGTSDTGTAESNTPDTTTPDSTTSPGAVQQTNHAPEITGTPPLQIDTSQHFEFQPVAQDFDNDTLSFSVLNKPVWASFNVTTGILQGTPGVEDAGVAQAIRIVVTDGISETSLPAFDLTITQLNHAPVLSGTPVEIVTPGESFSFTPQAEDVDASDTLVFSIENAPTWSQFDTTTGRLEGIPDAPQLQTNIIISVSDGKAVTRLPAFFIQVKEPINLAHGFGAAIQGSTYRSRYSAEQAIDGEPDSFNHTLCEATDNWWQVELPQGSTINRIVVHNRKSNASRLAGASVYLASSDYRTQLDPDTQIGTLSGSADPQEFEFFNAQHGRYVIIKATDNHCLHVTEVEVFGHGPQAPLIAEHASSFLVERMAGSDAEVWQIAADDLQNDTLSYTIDGDVPFAIDGNGVLTVSGALAPASSYAFNVTVSDGLHQATTSVSVQTTGDDAVNQALTSGDASAVTERELTDALNMTVEAIEARQQQLHNVLFALADDGTATSESLTSIDWNPTHDSVVFETSAFGGAMPLLISNDAAKRSESNHEVLAMAGIKENGARYALLGANALHDLSTTSYPQGSGNDQMNRFVENLIVWLTDSHSLEGSALKVTLAHQSDSYYFKHDASTSSWLATHLPDAVINAEDTCESSLLKNCLADTDLLIMGRDDGSRDNHGVDFDLAATLGAITDAQAAGLPILYVQTDGSQNDLGKALMRYFGVTTGDNYWSQEMLTNFNATSMQNDRLMPMYAVQNVINNLDTGMTPFSYTDAACTSSVGKVSCRTNDVIGDNGNTLQTELFSGAQILRNATKPFDEAGISVFSLDNSYRFNKLALLLADKYRETVHYPMDKTTTSSTDFARGLFADYAVHYARANNALQPDMGLFTDNQMALHNAVTMRNSVSNTPTRFSEWTSTGLYAPPGKRITVRRTDTSDNDVRLRFNMLRSTTRIWNPDGYNRPRFLTSHQITLAPGQTYTLSTPHGGPVYLWSRNVEQGAVAYTVEFDGVLDNPMLDSFDTNGIQSFADELLSTNSDWVDIKTPFTEIHSRKSHMQQALERQDGDRTNGYTISDVQDYIADLNGYLINGNYEYAGFIGRDLQAPNSAVEKYCTDAGLSAVAYGGSVRNLCTDARIHAIPKVQHINADINAFCGSLCSGNPFDSGSPIMPLGWGENHEMGHNLQRHLLKVYGGRTSEVSNNIFPLHTSWLWAQRQALGQHPSLNRPSNEQAFNLLQAAIAKGTPATIDHPLWVQSGIYDKAFERLSFYMQLVYTDQSWDLITRLYINERIFSDARRSEETWLTARHLLGFGNYSVEDAQAINGNDFLYIATSKITGRNYLDYFTAWGIQVNQPARDQVSAINISEQVPAQFYYVEGNLPVDMPTITLPLDGVSAWGDPG